MTTQAFSAAKRRIAEVRARAAMLRPHDPPEIERMKALVLYSTKHALEFRAALREHAAARSSWPDNGPRASEADGDCPKCGGWRSPVSGTCRRCARRQIEREGIPGCRSREGD